MLTLGEFPRIARGRATARLHELDELMIRLMIKFIIDASRVGVSKSLSLLREKILQKKYSEKIVEKISSKFLEKIYKKISQKNDPKNDAKNDRKNDRKIIKKMGTFS